MILPLGQKLTSLKVKMSLIMVSEPLVMTFISTYKDPVKDLNVAKENTILDIKEYLHLILRTLILL